MEAVVYNKEGKETGRTVVLPESVFGIEPNTHAVYLDVKHYLAAQRQGTHKAKERNEVAGSTKKLRKQKGTGAARIGDIKSPLLRGGGRIFGPRPRDYRFKLNKKTKQLARKSALSSKAAASNITVFEDFNFAAPSTKSFSGVLKNFNLEGKKLLVVLPAYNEVFLKSARNIPGIKVTTAAEINTYQVLKAEKVLVSEKSLTGIEQILIGQ